MRFRPFSLSFWQQPAIREHLKASALTLGLFLVIFFRAILGGEHYGALPHHQAMGLTWQNPWLGREDLPMTDRQPNMLDPDYHFLYELDAEAAARDLKAGHLPFFDFSRMLGVPLWGSIIFDFANPLNLLLRFFSVPAVHLIKVLFCMLLAANGFVVLLRELGARTSVGWMVATCLYLGTNFAIYYIHWIGAYGVYCIPPLLLGCMLRFLRTGSGGSFFGVFASACFVVIAQCSHMAVHLMLLCAVVCVAYLALSRKEWKTQLPRLALLGFAGLCAALACSEFISQMYTTLSNSSRIPAEYWTYLYPYEKLPRLQEAYSEFFFANVEHIGSFWDTVFMPWAALLSMAALCAWSAGWNRQVRVVGLVGIFFLIFFYVGWLDIPLFLTLGRLYAPNPLAWRGLFNLYLVVIALAALGADWLGSERTGKGVRTAAWVGLAVTLMLAFVVTFVERKDFRDPFFAMSGLLYNSYFHTFAFWLVLGGNALWLSALLLRGRRSLQTGLVVSGALAVCIGMHGSRVAFYDPKDVARLTRGDATDINTPRVARLIPSTDYLLGAVNIEMHYVLDSPLSTLGLKMLNGYHTSMSRQELKVFDSLVSDEHIKKRMEPGVLHSYSFGLYRTILEGRGIMLNNNTIRPEKVLTLKLLGVDYVIDAVGLAKSDPQPPYDFSKWPGVRLGTGSACSFVEGGKSNEVVSLFSGVLEADTVNTMLRHIKPAMLQPLPHEQGYRLELSGVAGTLVVPYHLARYFTVLLDGRPVPEPPDLGISVVEVTAQSKVVEIRACRGGLVTRTLAGILAGTGLALAGCYFCGRLAKPATAPSPVSSGHAPAEPPGTAATLAPSAEAKVRASKHKRSG